MNPNRIRLWFFFVASSLVLLLAMGGGYAVHLLSKVEQISKASDDLELLDHRVASRLKTQIYRLSASALRYEVLGEPEMRSNYLRYKGEIASFLASQQDQLVVRDEKELVEQIRRSLDAYLNEVDGIVSAADRTSQRGKGRLQSIQTLYERVVNTLSEIDDFEKKWEFRGRLQDVHSLFVVSYSSADAGYSERFRAGARELMWDVPDTEMGPQELKAQLLEELDEYVGGGYRFLSEVTVADSAKTLISHTERAHLLREELVELTERLGDFRRSNFQSALELQRKTSDKLKIGVVIAASISLIGVLALISLAVEAFLKPLRHRLAQAESIASQQEDLASIGMIASGLAHELRTPMSAIKARSFALLELAPTGSPAHKQARFIDDEVNRIDRLVTDFLDFSKPSEPDMETIHLERFLEAMLRACQPDAETKGVEIVMRFDSSEAIEVMADEDQIKQVLFNLLRNAIDACPPSEGLISVTVEPPTISASQRRTVSILIADNGSGIQVEHQNRIFEPFFSRRVGGTGLGLSISRNIVRNHGAGDLTFESGANGTSFCFHLPCAEK